MANQRAVEKNLCIWLSNFTSVKEHASGQGNNHFNYFCTGCGGISHLSVCSSPAIKEQMNTHVDTYNKNTIWQYFLTCGQSHMQTSSLMRSEASGTHRKLILSNLRAKFSCSHHLLWLHLMSNSHELYSDCVCVYVIDIISREQIFMTKLMAISDASVHTIVQSWHTAHKISATEKLCLPTAVWDTRRNVHTYAHVLLNIFTHMHIVHMQTSLTRMAQSARMPKAEEVYGCSICKKPCVYVKCAHLQHTHSLGRIQTEL